MDNSALEPAVRTSSAFAVGVTCGRYSVTVLLAALQCVMYGLISDVMFVHTERKCCPYNLHSAGHGLAISNRHHHHHRRV